jgi:hypothetical protein
VLCRKQILIENSGSDGVLASQNLGEMSGPQAAAGAQLQNALPWQDMEGMPDGQSSPSEFDRGRISIAQPVAFTATFHFLEVFSQ